MSNMEIVAEYQNISGPVDIVGMAYAMGIEYSEHSMRDNVSIRVDRERAKIHVNARMSKAQRRFSAAYGIATYLLCSDILRNSQEDHRGTLFGDTPQMIGPISEQNQNHAKRMAIQMLVPADRLRKSLSEYGHDVEKLSAEFAFPEKAMTIRLKNFA